MRKILKAFTPSIDTAEAYVRCFLLMIYHTAVAYLVICAVLIGALINQMDATLTEASDLVGVVQFVTMNRVLVFVAFLYGFAAMFIKNMGYYSRHNPLP